METNIIYNEDCVLGLKRLPDQSIDCVITDPPYGIDYKDNRKTDNPEFEDSKDTSLEVLDKVCKEIKRVIKRDAHLYFFFGMWNFTETKGILQKYFDLHPIPLIWVKNNHTLCDFSKRYACKYEPIWFCSNKEKPLKYKVSPDVFTFKIPLNKIHSSQKPVDLIKYLIENSTNKEDLVLDPFMGSGTTALACKHTGRNYIGFEILKHYYDIANKRLDFRTLDEYLPQPKHLYS